MKYVIIIVAVLVIALFTFLFPKNVKILGIRADHFFKKKDEDSK